MIVPAINLHCRGLSIAKFHYQMVPHGPRNYLIDPIQNLICVYLCEVWEN